MFTLLVEANGKKAERYDFDKEEVLIGRIPSGDIVLRSTNVSKQHARIVQRDGKFFIIDRKSTNGSYVNGKRVSAPQSLRNGDRLFIGDFHLTFVLNAEELGITLPKPKVAAPATGRTRTMRVPSQGIDPMMARTPTDIPGQPSGTPMDDPFAASRDEDTEPPPIPGMEAPEPLRLRVPEPPSTLTPPIHGARDFDPLGPGWTLPPLGIPAKAPALEMELSKKKGKKRTTKECRLELFAKAIDQPHYNESFFNHTWTDNDKVVTETRDELLHFAEELFGDTLDSSQSTDVVEKVTNELIGLGVIDRYLDDSEVEEILVNGPNQVLIVRDGRKENTGDVFSDETALQLALRRLLYQAKLDPSFAPTLPLLQVHLPNGLYVAAIREPYCTTGTALRIIKPTEEKCRFGTLNEKGVLNPEMSEAIQAYLAEKKNIFVCSKHETIRNRFLGAMLSAIKTEERIVAMNNGLCPAMDHDDYLAVNLRPLGLSNQGLETARRELVSIIPRLRADRVFMRGVNPSNIKDMLSMLNGGLMGAVLCGFGTGVRDALTRLEFMACIESSLERGLIQHLLGENIDVVIVLTELPDGSHKVSAIAEVCFAGGDYKVENKYVFDEEDGSFKAL